MIIGRIPGDQASVRLDVEIRCSNCGKRVPGGIRTGREYLKTEQFREELEDFKRGYLCGVCRDRKRTA